MTKAQTVGSKLEKLALLLEGLSLLGGMAGVALSGLQWLNAVDVDQSGPKSAGRLFFAMALACLAWIVAAIGGVIASRLVGAVGTGLVALGEISAATTYVAQRASIADVAGPQQRA